MVRVCAYVAIILVMIACLYPFIYILSVSLSDTDAVANQKVYLYPIGFQLDAYKIVMNNDSLWRGYVNSVVQSTLSTLITLILCSLAGYVLSVHLFKYKRAFMVFFIITMFFNGGIVPTYLVISKLGLIDTIWAIVIPPALGAWYIILFRVNFRQVPASLTEMAQMDGASHVWIYSKVMIPLCKAVFAVVAIYAFVNVWNSYFPPLLYLTSQDKMPLPIVIRKFTGAEVLRGDIETDIILAMGGRVYNALGLERSIKMATVIMSIGPIVFLYPLLQKYFNKGILVGSIKE